MEQKELSKAKLFYITSFKVGALYEALKIEIIVNNQQPMRKKEWLMMSLKSIYNNNSVCVCHYIQTRTDKQLRNKQIGNN